jgi:hypothetical protein
MANTDWLKGVSHNRSVYMNVTMTTVQDNDWKIISLLWYWINKISYYKPEKCEGTY